MNVLNTLKSFFKSRKGTCKNAGCGNKKSWTVHSAYCDKCLKKHREEVRNG